MHISCNEIAAGVLTSIVFGGDANMYLKYAFHD